MDQLTGSKFGKEYDKLYLFNLYAYLIYMQSAVCVCAKSLHLCLTLCDAMDCSPLGSSVQGILQARTLEWVAMPSSGASSQPRDRICVSLSPALTGVFFTTSVTWEALLLE